MADLSPSPAALVSTVPSSTNSGARPRLKEKNVHRESREKKETWRKKEATIGLSRDALTTNGTGNASGKQTGSNTPRGDNNEGSGNFPGLVKYRLPPPQFQDYYGHRAPPMTPSDIEGGDGELMVINDHPMNRRGFRYSPCEASHQLPLLSYRATEYEPFTPRINFEDMNVQVHANKTGNTISTSKGWRMARANVGVREGEWYYECKILQGITDGEEHAGHVRIGWARREAPLDAPVGFDAYSYGLRDQSGQKVHMSRPKEFHDTSFIKGDTIGLYISLPSLAVQRELSRDAVVKSADVIRDRLPIRFKNQLWFEHFEYQPTKDFEDLMSPAPGTKPGPSPQKLPDSCIKVFKNGVCIGTAWEDLFAFLPPASKPAAALGGRELDDGALGYYPAVSVFRGGKVEVNFGSDWFHPPEGLGDGVRGVWERYNEQIAEDVTYDLVDEIDLLFSESLAEGGTIEAGAASASGPAVKEEIKEMVMEDE